MIGGIIVLSLFLTALVSMVIVSQQYDTYQGKVNTMSQKDIDRASENLQGALPGVSGPYAVPNSPSCTGSNPCNSYTIYIANLGISTQIARIYITTNILASPLPTGAIPCTPCILDPASVDVSGNPIPTPYTFQASNSLINPGDPYHPVTLWLPSKNVLVWGGQLSGSQSITIVTTRGRVFSFLYPFLATGLPPSQEGIRAAVASGTMRVAYTGNYKSANEPASGGAGGSGYCHWETGQLWNIKTGGTTLNYVFPWITNTIYMDAFPNSGNGGTTVYIVAKFNNTISVISGGIQAGYLLISSAASGNNAKVYFLGGPLIGDAWVAGNTGIDTGDFSHLIYYPVGSSQPNIPVGTFIFSVFQITGWNSPSGNVGLPGVAFTGTASISNTATGVDYFGAQILLDGVYIRPSC
jgi:hypothetical protein